VPILIRCDIGACLKNGIVMPPMFWAFVCQNQLLFLLHCHLYLVASKYLSVLTIFLLHCHLYLVASKYLSVLTISLKICLLFGQHTVDGISHKSPHKYLPGFGTIQKFYFLSVFAKQLGPQFFLCFPWQSLSAQCLQCPEVP